MRRWRKEDLGWGCATFMSTERGKSGRLSCITYSIIVNVMRRPPRILIALLALIVISASTILTIKFAKGYRPSLKTKALRGTGLLAANSYPRGASVFINDKLTTATDDTLNLPPGDYKVKVQKDGFIPWEKNLTVEAELVTQTNTRLFPAVPTMTPVTFSGALNPLPAPDSQKILFAVQNATSDSKNGLYVLDLSDRPFGLNSDPRQITRTSSKYDLVNAQLTWSPDSGQILAIINEGEVDEATVILDQSRFNDIAELNDVTARLPLILTEWQEVLDKKNHEKIRELPELMQSVATGSAALAFAPEPEKLLYVPGKEITLPVELIPALPASSTQSQQRHIQPGNVYVYDLEEDKNFWIASVADTSEVFKKIQWYPDSRHLLITEDKKVIIAEYDGTNRHTVYAGPFSGDFSYPWSNGSSLLILASLNGGSNLPPNLYSINLK